MKRAIAHLGILMLLVAPAGLAAQADVLLTPEAALQPGDRFELQVWRNAELSGVFDVGSDGYVVHPIYGQVRVGGIPVTEAQARIGQFLREFEGEPRFVFRPQFRIYVGGAVRDQNQHFMRDVSVGQAITLAGGSTAPNRLHRVRLIRGGAVVVSNLNDPAVGQVLQVPVRSGDQILVEERPTFTRTYLNPSLQVLQTVTGLVATYVYLNAILGSRN